MGVWCVLFNVGGRLFGFVSGIRLGILLLRACPRVRSGAGKDVAQMGPLAFRFDPEDGSEQKSEVLHEEDCLTQGGTK